MLKVTRTLQAQIDEKNAKIEDQKAQLKAKKERAFEEKRKIKENFESAKTKEDKQREIYMEEQRREIQKMSEQEEDINFYYNNYEEKQAEILNEENRFKMLLRQLAEVEAQGAEDIEKQKQRINSTYFKELEEYQKEAQNKAERNISEIERNIQIQNQRLEDEADMQEKEYLYLQEKIRQIQADNEQCQAELKTRGLTVEDHSKKQYEKNKRIKMLKTKIDLLEKCLSQQVADFEKERELLKFQNEQIIRE